MRTLTIDIINDKALDLLKELEGLKMIKVHGEKASAVSGSSDWSKYKGAMSKQPLVEVDKQLNELRG